MFASATASRAINPSLEGENPWALMIPRHELLAVVVSIFDEAVFGYCYASSAIPQISHQLVEAPIYCRHSLY